MRQRKLLKYLITVLVVFYILNWYFVARKDSIRIQNRISYSFPSNANKFYLHPDWLENASSSKLLTLSTAFITTSAAGGSSDREKLYRHNAQLNFLTTTQFSSLQPFINFLVFTDDSEWVQLIRSEFPGVTTLSTPPTSAPPLLRDIFLRSMRLYDTPLYMFANADDLFDSSLLQTTRAVLREMSAGRLRSKLLLVGHRWDLAYRGRIKEERDVLKLMQHASKHYAVAKDYFIVSRDSVEWDTFPDFFIGRRWYDSFMVQQAFFSETELVDTSATVRLIHQVLRPGYWSSMHANSSQNEKNLLLLGPDSHSSIHCARYITSPPYSSIRVYDKQRGQFLHSLPSPPFLSRHNQLVSELLEMRQEEHTADCIISVLSYNRPASLSRLLSSLSQADYGEDVVDVCVLLDRGRTGAYDVHVLEVLVGHSWNRGNYWVQLQETHSGQLQQWLRAWELSHGHKALILEDDIMLSPHFYRILSTALSSYSSVSTLAGFSLDLSPSLVSHLPPHVGSILTSCYVSSGAFAPHPLQHTDFIHWYQSLPHTFQLPSSFPALYRHYCDTQGLQIGYLMDAAGDLATRAYFTTTGDSHFLIDICYDYTRSHIVKERPLLMSEPLISLPIPPPSSESLCQIPYFIV